MLVASFQSLPTFSQTTTYFPVIPYGCWPFVRRERADLASSLASERIHIRRGQLLSPSCSAAVFQSAWTSFEMKQCALIWNLGSSLNLVEHPLWVEGE
jgi:hypothetical protein